MIFLKNNQTSIKDLLTSKLFDENTFYRIFTEDLLKCKEEVIIESPFITSQRMSTFSPIFKQLLNQGVKIYIFTRDPKDQGENLEEQAENEITNFENMGVHVLLCTGNHHRKLAILDRKILWEGSLNILSQVKSREIMRRMESEELTLQMFKFLKLAKFLE